MGQELQRLFSLQDRPLMEDKKNLLITELENEGLPVGAVIAGVRSLVDEDLKSIKFITIKDASKKFITHMFDDYQCLQCKGHGVIRMKASGPMYEHETYVACTCQRGKTLADAHGIVHWHGEDRQMNGEFELVKI